MATYTVGFGQRFVTITAVMNSGVLKPTDTLNLRTGYHNGQETITVNNLTIVGNTTNTPIALAFDPAILSLTLQGAAPIAILDNVKNNGIVGSSGNNTITVTGGIDKVNAGDGIDRLIVNYNSNSAVIMSVPKPNAGGGYDGKFETVGHRASFTSVEAFTFNNTGLGNDTILTREGNDVINSGAGIDLISCGLGIDRVDGGAGNDTLDYRDRAQAMFVTLNAATDTVVKFNNVNEDTIKNVESIWAGSGSDTLIGDGLANSFLGGDGDDVVRGGAGNDTLDGGNGNDMADYRDKSGSVAVTLNGVANATVKVNNVNEDTIRNVEQVYGGAAADTLTGDGLANLFRGSGGNDALDGRGGSDIADYRDKTAALAVTLNGSANVAVKVNNVNEDTIRNVEQVYGGSGIDALTGDGLGNLFRGGGGKDVLDGRAGVDTADYSDKTTAIVATLNRTTNAVVRVNKVSEDTIRNIENLIGGNGNDTLTGDVLVNALTGNGGNDTLKGGQRQDTLDGGTGTDTADYGDKTTAVAAALNGGTNAIVRVSNLSEDTIRNVENLIGGSAGDTLSGDGLVNILMGNGGSDLIRGGGAADRLDGGAGSDTADFSDITEAVAAAVKGATAVIVQVDHVDADIIRNFENLIGGSGNDTLVGDGFVNVLSGLRGNDFLRGAAGRDTLDGGDGSDTADYSDKTQRLVVALDLDANVFVKVNNVDEDTIRNIENIIGGSANDTLTGDAADNLFRGGAGADALDGGDGMDIADFSDKTEALSVKLDENTSLSVGGDAIKNIEGVFGGSANDTLTGDTLDNHFCGGGGNDVLDGGDGRDTADFSDKAQAVSVTLNLAANTIVKVGNVDEDTIKNIENVIGGAAADTLTGDTENNTFLGGGGRDLITGNGGTDIADYSDKTQSVSVTLNGDTTAFVKVNNVIEDTIRSIEQLVGGSAADNLVGDTAINSLEGGGGNDLLRAGDGNDVLVGGLDNDTLTGGAGRDLFVFDTAPGAANVDTITDFVVADDFVGVDKDIFTGIADVAGAIPADTFVQGAAAQDAEDRLIYNSATGALLFDANGNGGTAAVQFAALARGLAITAANFSLT